MEWANWLLIGAALLTIVVIAYKAGRWTRQIEMRVGALETFLGWLIFLHRDELLRLYERYYPLGSSQPFEKGELLKEFKEGTIGLEGIERLRPLLERQEAEARAKGAIGAVIAIRGMLLALDALLIVAGRKPLP